MKKQLIVIEIVILLLIVGLSGCTSSETDGIHFRGNTINKPNIVVSEEYKTICKEVEVSDLDVYLGTYNGSDVVTRGKIKSITLLDDGITACKLEESSSFGWIYIIYVFTEVNMTFSEGDFISVYGMVQGEGDFDYYIGKDTYIWGFFFEQAYPQPSFFLPDYVELELFEKAGYSHPTYKEMSNFISKDTTDTREYKKGFVCADFSRVTMEHAKDQGYLCGEATLWPEEDPMIENQTTHSIICFNTTDLGLYFVEPQMDAIFSEQDMDEMIKRGTYDISVKHDNVEEYFDLKLSRCNIHWHYCLGPFNVPMEDYEWDYELGAWVIQFEGNEYIIEDK